MNTRNHCTCECLKKQSLVLFTNKTGSYARASRALHRAKYPPSGAYAIDAVNNRVHTLSTHKRGESQPRKATILDMRRNPKKILDAIERNETVILTNRGNAVARIEPIRRLDRPSMKDQEAFGMWAKREDMTDPVAYVRALRKGALDDL